MPQYSKTLTLNKGVDNQIQFQFLNQEQKPVDITGKSITFRLISFDGRSLLLEKALDLVFAATGIAALNLSAADIENIDAQRAHYSLEIPTGSFGYPVFIDQNAGARGDINIVNSTLPSFVPSMPVSIPTGQPFPNTPNANANTYIYSTSVINTEGSGILTLQAKYTEFFGNVVIEGSTIPDGDWYPIQLHSYANTTDTFGYVLKGFHPYVRVSFNSNSGAVTNVLAR